MALNKTLKVRLSEEQLKKAEDDSKAKFGKNNKVSEHVRDLIVNFEVVRGDKND